MYLCLSRRIVIAVALLAVSGGLLGSGSDKILRRCTDPNCNAASAPRWRARSCSGRSRATTYRCKQLADTRRRPREGHARPRRHVATSTAARCDIFGAAYRLDSVPWFPRAHAVTLQRNGALSQPRMSESGRTCKLIIILERARCLRRRRRHSTQGLAVCSEGADRSPVSSRRRHVEHRQSECIKSLCAVW